MSYKIAVASSDQRTIDLNFGAASEFLIYEVWENGEFGLIEKRKIPETLQEGEMTSCGEKGECKGGGCHGGGPQNPRVEMISDCRCLLCKRTGNPIQKQLDRKAISSFDVDGEIEEAIHKIVLYFYRVDHHHSLRGIANGSVI